MLETPRAFEESVAVAAVLALADDPQITDTSLAEPRSPCWAISGQRTKIVAAWQARVGAGDDVLVTRLLGLFEWTSLWATDGDHLAPYIHALWPASGRTEVFSHIEHSMASPNAVVRAAVCELWLRAAEGRRAFEDRQIDKLVRSAVAIAEAGTRTDDERAASRALLDMSHAGARHALIDAIRHATTKNNDELRGSCYRGLSRIEHPAVWPFFIERMFADREAYGALMAAIGTSGSTAPAIVRCSRKLARRATEPDAIHAATMYAEVLVGKLHRRACSSSSRASDARLAAADQRRRAPAALRLRASHARRTRDPRT